MTDQQKIPAGCKLTEVGVIPTDWELKKLGKIATYRRGSFPQPYGLAKRYNDSTGFPFTQVFDVDDNFKLKSETKRKISEEAQKYSVLAKKGTVIITIQGSIGRIAVVQYDTYVDRTLLIFESFNVPLDQYYFVYVLHLLFKLEKEKAPGGIIKTITKEALTDFFIPLPPTLTEQTRIATTLSDIDNLISQLDELIAKKKLIKQGAMQKLLTPQKDWEIKTIEELEQQGSIKLVRGKVISKKDILSNPGDNPIYSSSIHNNGEFGKYGKFMFDEELITWSVDGGGNFFYRPKHKFSVTNVCGYMYVDTKKINYQFLALELQLLHSRLFFDYTMKAHPSIIRKAYTVFFPALEEQIQIANIFSDIDNEIKTLEEKKAKYEQIKQGAMQQLLTGKIRLK